MIAPLPIDFPHVTFSASDGQQWRVHDKGREAWYFASVESRSDGAPTGRFDLHDPHGTCYVGAYDTAVTMEVLSLAGLSPQEAQEAVADREVSAMALDAFHGKPIADFTSPLLEQFGAPAYIEKLEHSDARPWAQAAWDVGFHGIQYRLEKDPEHRVGLVGLLRVEAQQKPSQTVLAPALSCHVVAHPPEGMAHRVEGPAALAFVVVVEAYDVGAPAILGDIRPCRALAPWFSHGPGPARASRRACGYSASRRPSDQPLPCLTMEVLYQLSYVGAKPES